MTGGSNLAWCTFLYLRLFSRRLVARQVFASFAQRSCAVSPTTCRLLLHISTFLFPLKRSFSPRLCCLS